MPYRLEPNKLAKESDMPNSSSKDALAQLGAEPLDGSGFEDERSESQEENASAELEVVE